MNGTGSTQETGSGWRIPIRPRWKRWFGMWLPAVIGHVTFAPRSVEYAEVPPPPGLAIDRETGVVTGIPRESGVIRVLPTVDGWTFVSPVLVRRRHWRSTP